MFTDTAKISIQKTVISSHSSNSNINIYLNYNAVECTIEMSIILIK